MFQDYQDTVESGAVKWGDDVAEVVKVPPSDPASSTTEITYTLEIDGVEYTIYMSAPAGDWKAAEEQYINVNVRGTWHVLQACRENGVKKVVLCSSISACGLSEMRADWKPQYLPVDEAHENKPYQAYSVSKIVMEQMAKSFSEASDMEVICLRPLAVVLPETIAEYIQFVDSPQRNWLFYYIWAADLARAFEAADAAVAAQRHQRQPPVEQEHPRYDGQNDDQVAENVDHARGEQLVKSIDV